MPNLYKLSVTEGGEKASVYVIAEDVDGVIQAIHDHHGDEVDADSLEPYVEGDKRPRKVPNLDAVPADEHDFVPWGENDEEITVAEFFDIEGEEEGDGEE